MPIATNTDWRKIEAAVVRFMRSSGVEVIDLCGAPLIAVHRSKHNDERTIFDLEVLSRYLAEVIDGR